MPSLTIVDRQGKAHAIAPEAGSSIVEIIRDAGFNELLAVCGGGCSCKTCHVCVVGDTAGLPGEAENDLLDSSDHRTSSSRLSCRSNSHRNRRTDRAHHPRGLSY